MTLLQSFDELLAAFGPHFKRAETFERARTLAYSHLVTFGRHTISRLICSKNTQHQDWSADYKFFSLRQWQPQELFFEILKVCDQYSDWPDRALVGSLDASVRKKTGRTIPGVATLRDPMSLPYHVNLVPGLRYLEASVLIAPEQKLQYHRAIPIYFEEAPPARKPRSNASEQLQERYAQEKKTQNLSVQGHQAVLAIRKQIDRLPDGANRVFFLTVDGAFCNRRFLRQLPANVVAIARARKDMKLVQPAEAPTTPGKGRTRIYGERLPTPEEMRQDDDTYPWHRARIFAAGKYHELRYKTVGPVLWPTGTRGQPMRLLIIAPLRYRKSKRSKLLYRQPAYLLVPEGPTPAEHLIQFYFLHWDIEVNHRDQKSLFGLYDAQVRSKNSVKRSPQFTAIIYSLVLLASVCAYGAQRTEHYLPLPKWRKQTDRRPSTLDILAQFRRELMWDQLQSDLERTPKPKASKPSRRKRPRSNIEAKKRGFVSEPDQQRSPLKLPINIISALLYADA